MKHTIRILGKSGDEALTYDPEVETEFRIAEKKFNELQDKGYSMFSVDPETKETELIRSLFKTTPQIIAVPQVSGG